jgi:regulator of protease activity HflC (stomatin/prohibitin superfamily)
MYEIEGLEGPKEKRGSGTRRFLFVAVVCLIATTIGMIIDNRWVGTPVLVASLIFLGWSFPNEKARRIVFAISLILGLALLLSLLAKDLIASGFSERISEGTLQWIVGFFFLALPIAAFIIVAPLWAAMWVSSEYILGLHQEPFQISRGEAMRLLFSLVFATNYLVATIEDGKEIPGKKGGLLKFLGGPGKVIIRPSNAVVFERGGIISRIEGPGVVITKRAEFIKAVVDLRPQYVLRPVENVLTHDRVPLKLTLGVGFQIESKKDVDARPESHISPDGEALSRLISENPFSVYESSVRKAVYNAAGGDWQGTIPGASESIIRDIILTYSLDQIFNLSGKPTPEGFFPTDQRTIEQIERRANEVLERISPNWGVRYGGVDLRVIEMPDEVRQRMLAVWETEWKNRIKLEEARAEGKSKAQVIGAIERVRSKAGDDVVSQIGRMASVLKDMPAGVRIRFISVFEQLSRNIVTDDIVATRYIEALETMAKSAGTKALFISEGKPEALGPGELHDISERMEKSE